MTIKNTHQEEMITMSQAQLQELISAQIEKATQTAVQDTIARFTKEQEEAKQPAKKKAPNKKKAATDGTKKDTADTKKGPAKKKDPKEAAIDEAVGDLYDELTEKEEELKEEAMKASKAKNFERFNELMAMYKEVAAKRMALINKHSKSIFNEERTAKTRASVAKALRGTADTTHSINDTIISTTQGLLIKTTDLLAGTIKASVNIAADVANGANDLGKEVVYKVADAIDVKKEG